MTEIVKTIAAFTDEAGSRGYVRKLTDASDYEISLLCSLLIPSEHVDMIRDLFRTPFDKFCSAMPEGAKCHITDAFEPGRDAWRVVAEEVRQEIFSIIKDYRVFLIFAARRLKLSREMHEFLEGLKHDAIKNRRSDFVVRNSNRPSKTQVDDDVMLNLALIAEAFAEAQDRDLVDFYFDDIDNAVAERYRAAIDETRNIENFERNVEARDSKTGKIAKGTIQISVELQGLDTRALGQVLIAGKNDPIILAVDIVTNSLWRHLQGLPLQAPLNEESSVKDWDCYTLTFVAPKDSIFDRL